MRNIIKALLVILALKSVYATDQSYIHVRYGEIYVQGYDNCTLIINGLEVNVQSQGPMPGRHYGLIKYNCGNDKGYLISKMDCKDCGFYCEYNQMIVNCNQYWPLFIVSMCVTLMFMGLIIYLLRSKISSLVLWSLQRCITAYYTRKDERAIKKLIKLNKMTGFTNIKAVYKDLDQTIKDPEMKEAVGKARNLNVEKMSKKMPVAVGETSSIPGTSSAIAAPNALKVPTIIRPPLNANVLAITMLVMIIVPFGDACNSVLYLTSNNLICGLDGCNDLNIIRFAMMTNEIVCFKDQNGELLEFKIAESSVVNRYELVYYTSSYTIGVKSNYHCKRSIYGSCWETSNCHKLFDGPEASSIKVDEKPMRRVGTGCGETSLSCDKGCYHNAACVFYKWFVDPVGPRYPVYKKVYKMWELKIQVTYLGITTKYTLTTNDPSVNLDSLLSNKNSLPIYIVSNQYHDIMYDDHLILVNGTALEIRAAAKNMPETEVIGDYQMSTDLMTQTFNDHNIDCTVHFCKAKCTMPYPAVDKIANTMLGKTSPIQFSMLHNSLGVETRTRISSVVDIMINKKGITNLEVIPPSCIIEVVQNFACEACGVLPYSIFVSSNIHQGGAVPFNSNCTFDRNTLSCSSEPSQLMLLTYEKYCLIDLYSLNLTLITNYNYVYLGKMDYYRSIASRNEDESYYSAVKDPAVLDGFLTAITAVSLLTTLGILISKLMQVFLVFSLSRVRDSNNV